MGLINLQQLQNKEYPTEERKSQRIFNAFLIGVTFSFGWIPCVGPVLSSVLAIIAASGGNGALQGALLMLVYTLGLALPSYSWLWLQAGSCNALPNSSPIWGP